MDESGPTSVRAVIRRWIGPVAPLPYLLAGLVVVGVGQLIDRFDMLKPVARFADTALRQVSAFSPLSLAYGFPGQLDKRWDVMDIVGAYVRTDCRRMSFADPESANPALYRTDGDVRGNPDMAAMLILLASLVTGFMICWRLASSPSTNSGGGPVGILVSLIAAPFVGSGIAFVLQLAGIVIFALACAVVGFLIWVGAHMARFLAVLKAGRAVQENAAMLKKIDDRLRPPPP